MMKSSLSSRSFRAKLFVTPVFIIATFLVSFGYGLKASAGTADVEYFKQFLYKKENTSSDPDFPSYQHRFLMTTWNDMIRRPDGKYLNPVSNLFMYEDGTFILIYKENYFDNPNGGSFFPGPCKKIQGRWSVPDKTLVLEGLGIGERTTIHGSQGVRLTYQRDIHSPQLKGHSVDAGYGISNFGEAVCFGF